MKENLMPITLQNARDNINNNIYVLPAIQRDFIWEPEKIECLFDSIMRGYPIGTFLLWKMNREQKDNYRFYKFNDAYVRGEHQDIINSPLSPTNQYAVLDGQQRLTSISIALSGSYTFSRRGRTYPQKRKLYFNLLNNEENPDIKYEFKFLSNEEIKQDKMHYWYLVNNVLIKKNWPHGMASSFAVYQNELASQNITNEQTREAFTAQQTDVITKLSLLYQRIMMDQIIIISETDTTNEDEILDIFVRLNSQGKILKGTDLIFSKIVGIWKDAREQIETLIDSPKIKKFKIFDKDFIMKLCLALIQNEAVSKIKVSNFQRPTVEKIQNQWNDIKKSIEETSSLLNFLGYNGETISSSNTIIPLTYFIFNGGCWKTANGLNENGLDIKKYLATVRIAQTFSEKTTDKLKIILNEIKKYQNDRPFSKLLTNKLFTITEENLENALFCTKGREAFNILSLLYDKKYDECSFDQDHIHPLSSFKKNNLKQFNLTDEQINDWIKKADTLPNLQILKSTENSSKNDTPFEEWVNKTYITTEKKNQYLEETYIDKNLSLKLDNFVSFYESRKNTIKKQLVKILDIKISPQY